jgi:hypothetical protein
MRLNLVSQRQEAVGLAAHRGHHHHQLVARTLPAGYPPRDILDALGAADRCAAVFLDNQRHATTPGNSKALNFIVIP